MTATRVPGDRFVLLALLVGHSANLLFSQTPDTVTIQGRVADATEAPMSGVAITITNPLTGSKRSVKTDSNGNFAVAGLPAGTSYTLIAAAKGFAPSKLSGLNPAGGTAADLNIVLKVAGKVSQVTVTRTPGQVRTDAPQIGDRIIGQQLQETPILDRRITFLPLLNSANKPAINQGDIFTNLFLFTTDGSGCPYLLNNSRR